MITKELINRINELAKKKRENTITNLELEEQKVLRQRYLDAMRERVIFQLEGIEFTDEDEKKAN